jgi:membrane-anchored glycerophosphoryl diester phosphodiesterase (GDPDase)
LNNEKPKLSDVLDANRSIIIVLLGLPVIGMLIAAGLIIYKKPDNMVVVLGVITFVGIQYIITMFFLMKRVEGMTNKHQKIQDDENKDEKRNFECLQ